MRFSTPSQTRSKRNERQGAKIATVGNAKKCKNEKGFLLFPPTFWRSWRLGVHFSSFAQRRSFANASSSLRTSASAAASWSRDSCTSWGCFGDVGFVAETVSHGFHLLLFRLDFLGKFRFLGIGVDQACDENFIACRTSGHGIRCRGQILPHRFKGAGRKQSRSIHDCSLSARQSRLSF